MAFIDKTTVVEAATLYHGSDLVGNDYTVSLPDVVPVTADVGGLMGTMSIPLLNSLESMELTITKVGIDKHASRICTPGKKNLMVKWVQDQVNSDGDVKPVGCQANFSCLPKAYMPTADIEVGEATEFDCTFEVYRYQLYHDGQCILEVDRLAGTLKAWDGKKLVDYGASYAKLL